MFGYPDETLSLVFDVSLQTRKTVSDHISKQREVENTTLSGVCLTNYDVFEKGGQILFLSVFLNLSLRRNGEVKS